MKRHARELYVSVAIFSMAALSAAADPTIAITSAIQRYPWESTVEIAYSVTGSTGRDCYAVFEAKTKTGAFCGCVTNLLTDSGNVTATALLSPTISDYLDGVTITPTIYRSRDYLIVNLENWNVSYECSLDQQASNSRYNTNEYKTKKMVFRRIPSGRYTIAGNANLYVEQNYGQRVLNNRQVYFPASFYMGIFRLTKAQYSYLSGKSISGTQDSCIITNFATLRGTSTYNAAPPSGPLYNLRTKTGLLVDAPTRAMLRVAATMGWSSLAQWPNGDTGVVPSQSVMNYMWCAENKGSYTYDTVPVGAKLPSKWGLYDTASIYHTMALDCCPSTDSSASSTPTLDSEEASLASKNNFIPARPGVADKWTYSAGNLDQSYTNKYNSFNSSWWGGTHNVSIRLAVYPSGYYPNGGQ